MGKNIVVCSDGTGNADIIGRGSNVFKLFESVELRGNGYEPGQCSQIAIYHDGVGTEDFRPLKLLGGAFGWGFSRHVRDLYTELARVYEPGDKIFMFGFSRGAFTVRTLSCLIASVGLVDVSKVECDADLKALVKQAYAAHRRCYRRFSRLRKSPPDSGPADEFRARYAIEDVTPVEFVGVWDTVDAVGFPLDEVADFWNDVIYPFRFPDLNLCGNIRCARHAISIDDQRRTFHPEMWNETEETQASGRIRQVWFAGVHSNVGGGYPKQGLSLIPLVWMMTEAAARGLRFVPSVHSLYIELQNAFDKLYDSRAGLAAYYGYKPRDMGEICAAHRVTPLLHISVLERIAEGTKGYAPGNLAAGSVVVPDNPGMDTSEVQAVLDSVLERKGRLGKANKWIQLWRWSQGGLVVATLAALLLYCQAFGVKGVEALLTFDGYLQFGRFVAWDRPALLTAMALMWFLCHVASRRLRRIYSEFWFGSRRELRKALDECFRPMAAGMAPR